MQACECRKPLSPLCDLGVFVDQAAEPVTSDHLAVVAQRDGQGLCAAAGRPLSEAAVRPMRIVMVGVLSHNQTEVAFAGDEDTVDHLAPA